MVEPHKRGAADGFDDVTVDLAHKICFVFCRFLGVGDYPYRSHVQPASRPSIPLEGANKRPASQLRLAPQASLGGTLISRNSRRGAA
jgi:hypothetical protein